MKVFSTLAGKGSKRVGALYVTCQLFKTYFKLGTVHLCRSVIRSIETARIFDFEEFPVRDKVTYMYYTGRLEVYNENFPAADHKLSYALTRCDARKEANIRSVYIFYSRSTTTSCRMEAVLFSLSKLSVVTLPSKLKSVVVLLDLLSLTLLVLLLFLIHILLIG